MNNLTSHLFETNAVNVCPENKPFWYTSGKIGPYYINSEFLYGSKQAATDLLSFIDENKSKIYELPGLLFNKIIKQYSDNKIFQDTINEMLSLIKSNINIDDIEYISGGERRDWFFSIIIAHLLNKPHITIYKDLKLVLSDSNFVNTKNVTDINSSKVLHVADLITEASSYFRAWIPAIQSINGNIVWSLAAIDRLQGGTSKLRECGITPICIVEVNKNLFDEALNLQVINKSQFDMIIKFLNNPDETMKEFLIAHPEFLENALNSDAKTAGRAKLCIDSNLYGLN